MAKQSTSGSPAFKAVSYKTPEPVSATRRAAIYESFPVPVYLVMRTDWRFSKRSDRHPQQTTTVVSAFTTLLSAQEAALIGFDKFVQEYAGEKSAAENRFRWYSRLHGKNKAYRDVKEIVEDMKTWQTKWKGISAEERYEKMLEAMAAVKPRLSSGSIFDVEQAALPPAARARAVNPIDPVPFRIFVLTQNHWSWSKSVDDTTILGIFTCLNQARVEGVDAYHAYIHSSDQERKRLKWDKTADNAYDRMLANVVSDKLAWEKTSREYGTSFSIDDCFCYPRGAYFRHEDEVLPKVQQEDPVSSKLADSSSSHIHPPPPAAEKPTSGPAAVIAPHFPQPLTKPAEQVPRANLSSSAVSQLYSQPVTKAVEKVSSPIPPSPVVVQKEKPYAPVVKNTGEDGPRAHGFIWKTYAVNSEKKNENDCRKSGIIQPGSDGTAAGKKGLLRGLEMARARYDRWKKDDRDVGGRGAGGRSTRFGSSRHSKVDPEEEEAEERERHDEIQGEEDGGSKWRRRTWSAQEFEKKNEEDPSSFVNQKEDVAEAWAQARARRAYAEAKVLPDDPDKRDLQGKKKNLPERDVRANVETARSENVVYHRAYGYVASEKNPRRNLQDERKDELTSEGEKADDEVSVQSVIRRNGNQRRTVDEQVDVKFASEVHKKVSYPTKRTGGARSGLYNEHELPAKGKGKFQRKGSDTVGKPEDSSSPFEDITGKKKTDEEVRGDYCNPFDDPPSENSGIEVERTPKGYRNPFDDPPSETGKRSEVEHSDGDHVADNPPLVRKPRKPDEKISKYLEDQLKCLFSRKGRDDEVPSDDQTDSDPAILSSGRREEPHSGKTLYADERSDLNKAEEQTVHSNGDYHRKNNGATARKAFDSRDVASEQVKDHRGFGFSSVSHEDFNHVDADDPPLIRKSRHRKGADRYGGGVSEREIHNPTESSHFVSGSPKDEDISTAKKSGGRKVSWSKDDVVRGDSWRRENSRQQAGNSADYEVDQVEESSVEEQHVGPRKEAPHLDLALKRHRAGLRTPEEVSEKDFNCGRYPVDGGSRFGLIGRMKKILNKVTTVPEDWSD